MVKRLIFFPKDHLVLVVPVLLLTGFITGLLFDTGPLKKFILPVTVLMIYPTMIGFQPSQLFNLSHSRLILISLGINFLAVPILAKTIGSTLLSSDPLLFAGLAISSLLPTSNMTVAFTMMAKGNVPAALKLTVISLIMGSLLAPWYLLIMVGKYVPIDPITTMKTIAFVVFIPMTLGVLTYKGLMTRYSQEEFNQQIKPFLPAISAWGMVYIIFTSISTNAERVMGRWDLVGVALLGQMVFYIVNYALAALIARKLFNREDGFTLIYSTVLRNLSISLGLAATAFGPNAALMVTLAFLLQQQGAAWFTKLDKKYGFWDKSQLT